EGFLLVLQHLFSCIIHTSTAPYKSNNFGSLIFVFIVVFYQIDNISLGGGVSFFKGIDKGQGHLFFFDVISHRFPYVVETEIKKIILYLKSYSYFFSEQAQTVDGLLWSICRGCATRAACCNEGGRFLTDNFKIYVFLNVEFAFFFDLQELPLAHFFHGIRHNF